jgi:hypothetical protein
MKKILATILYIVLIPMFISAQTENKLAVVITSVSPSDEEPLNLRGYYIYVLKGKEVKEEIDKNAWGWNFEGDYIKEVRVEKVSGEGSFQLFVIENDEFIFESGSVDSKSPVVYKREENKK